MQKVTLPEMVKGKWRVEKFTVDCVDLRELIRGRAVPVGETFTRLMRGATLVMSDTPAEMADHLVPLVKASGDCLINGLGLGMLLKNILKSSIVRSVTVIEKDQELIDLISPYYSDPRVTIMCADALEYKPAKGAYYNMVWHDIWDYICADNVPEMQKLHRKYGRRTEWQGSWCRTQCEDALRRERRDAQSFFRKLEQQQKGDLNGRSI